MSIKIITVHYFENSPKEPITFITKKLIYVYLIKVIIFFSMCHEMSLSHNYVNVLFSLHGLEIKSKQNFSWDYENISKDG